MPKKPSNEALATLEVLSSIVAVCAIPAILLAYTGAHFTLSSDPAVIDADHVRFYWTCVLVFALAVVATFVLASLRGGRATVVWHSMVAFVGVVVALAFSVTQTGTVGRDTPEPDEPRRSPFGSACHSGGDNRGCPGG